MSDFWNSLSGQLGRRFWARAAQAAQGENTPAEKLAQIGKAAKQQRHLMDDIIQNTESRLKLAASPDDGIVRPLGSDWAWRPLLWSAPMVPHVLVGAPSKTALGDQLRLFHDGDAGQLVVRQTEGTQSDAAPYRLGLEAFNLDSSYLSLVLTVPDAPVKDLKLRHLISLRLRYTMEAPTKVFARLNVKHGPNVETVLRELPPGEADTTVEFDMAYTKLNEKRVESMWLDLIFDRPAMNRISIIDLTMARFPRAEM
ncbi:hypothetical protein BVG79_00309 [Ketogulonicigenium robustum]|uniref:Uncharacterized protein n=1 Tax=Ketogulonicigenium robustum TaxID=92947 RepID=A0A1W6NXD1_9RHOB|nr:DUF6478 family protein [Ketogulonicigenium robustum]ARO13667.1 hypothetical protein BVG79_00309 [Ketogulonicigenium robustum]